MVEAIAAEIIQSCDSVSWNDVGGLEHAKKAVQEAVIWPLKRPELFTVTTLLLHWLWHLSRPSLFNLLQ